VRRHQQATNDAYRDARIFHILSISGFHMAILADRPALAMRNVALAELVILVVTPESLFTEGFQLSFAAVTALVAGYEAYRLRTDRMRRQGANVASQATGPLRWLRSLWLFLAATVATTLLAGFATAPIAAYHFHQTQTFAVATNLIAVPLSNLIVMPDALAAFLMMPCSMEAYPLAIM
jgi:competence protein ComEC